MKIEGMGFVEAVHTVLSSMGIYVCEHGRHGQYRQRHRQKSPDAISPAKTTNSTYPTRPDNHTYPMNSTNPVAMKDTSLTLSTPSMPTPPKATQEILPTYPMPSTQSSMTPTPQMNKMSEQQREQQPKEQQPKQQPKLTFVLPEKCWNPARAKKYLEGRGIDHEIVSYLIRQKLVYQSKFGSNCVFVGIDKEGNARYATMRGTGDKKFICDVKGSDKAYSFSLPAVVDNATVISVYESPVDLLSAMTMDKMAAERGYTNAIADAYDTNDDDDADIDGIDDTNAVAKQGIDIESSTSPIWRKWWSEHRLSLGCTAPVALLRYLADYPEIKTINLCLDADVAGERASHKIKSMLEEKGYVINIKPPTVGKDYNDMLMAAREASAYSNESAIHPLHANVSYTAKVAKSRNGFAI